MPLPNKLAKRIADLICALGISNFRVIFFNLSVGLISTGSPPLLVSITAPIFLSGSATLSIGLFLSDLSPVRVDPKSCAAKIPINIRIEVPELPKFSGILGSISPSNPVPLISMISFFK